MIPQHVTMSSQAHIDTIAKSKQECGAKALVVLDICQEHTATLPWYVRMSEPSCSSRTNTYYTLCAKYWDLEKIITVK